MSSKAYEEIDYGPTSFAVKEETRRASNRPGKSHATPRHDADDGEQRRDTYMLSCICGKKEKEEEGSDADDCLNIEMNRLTSLP
ncbi:MAG: hypothetical protein Q9193_005947, partial [Seirophora villosa]